ncbi:MAG: nucleoside monophosphate kinase, partial [Acidobacteriota bacterium]|nr:nucleoside monophosphate kinase [Acidobacteriota bacterium]
MVLLLFGAPGCGKGTQGQMILDWLSVKIPAISTGEMLRAEMAAGTALGAESKAVVAAGGLVQDGLVNRLLEARVNRRDCDEGFLLDGYPRTIEQADFLDGLLDRRGLPAPLVIHLDVPFDVLIGRMLCRRQCGECAIMFNILSKRPKVPGRCDECGGPLIIRRDDREEVIRERLRTYEAQTRPVLSHYSSGNYFKIGADRSPAYIFKAITAV